MVPRPSKRRKQTKTQHKLQGTLDEQQLQGRDQTVRLTTNAGSVSIVQKTTVAPFHAPHKACKLTAACQRSACTGREYRAAGG
jgi:hypothetical protein